MSHFAMSAGIKHENITGNLVLNVDRILLSLRKNGDESPKRRRQSMNNLLDDLNDAQRAAVVSTAPVILCLAGAGTGKTKTLTHRIARLYQDEGVYPENILALTFTRLAGMEMKDRIIKLIGEDGRKVFCNTFHAFAVSVLRDYGHLIGIEPNFSIYDQEDRETILQEIVKGFGEQTTLKKVLQRFECSEDEEIAETYAKFTEECRVLKEYGYRLRQNNAVDLDRLIDLVNKLWADHPEVLEHYRRFYPYVFVDEFQDTNNEQMRMLELLHPDNIFFVGDDYQAIYGWRGAKVEFIIDLPTYRPDCEVIKLEENYRSTRQIVEAANNVIAHNTRQTKKTLIGQKDGLEVEVFNYPLTLNENYGILSLINMVHSIGVDFIDIAVLARTNAQIDEIKNFLDSQNVSSQVISGSDDVFKKPDIKSLIAWLDVLCNKNDSVHLKRALMFPKPYVTPMELQKLELDALENDVSLFTMLRHPDGPGMEFFCDLSHLFEYTADASVPSEYFLTLIEVLDIKKHYRDNGLGNRLITIDLAESQIRHWEDSMIRAGEDYTLRAFLKWLRFRDIQEKLLRKRQDSVNLMTIHAAKGLEFNTVIVAGMNQGVFPSKRTSDLEEERRLFYVAITRAKEHLFITRAENVADWGGKMKKTEPSQFIEEMGI
jgi:DNA helicase-2/ATP-dependent DNA helicase PcrA